MNKNSVFRHQHSGILSLVAVEAPRVVTSDWIDEQLAETYQRNGLRPGLLAGLAGIEERRWWDDDVSFTDAAAMAGRAAIEKAGIDPSKIGILISTSVCKENLEPSVACAVHHQLGLSTSCLNFDIANACLGFINAMHLAATMLDAGTVEYALIVDGEGSRYTQQTTLERLRHPNSTAGDVFAEFASLTLGSGAAAMVMARKNRHGDVHRLIGGVARAGTEHNALCIGNLDRMTTDTHGLLVAGLDLAADAWEASKADFDWTDGLDWYIFHQVSKVHTTMLCDRLAIDPSKVPLTFPKYGNVGPAAVPITLASVQDQIEPGQRVLCMGIGSGLNTSFSEILW
ncbi:MAG: 3-oxoacyl-ACP synthase III [Actinomycetota bacterium]|nr:3-oxoacyl-ACP synthase III [Actinomycetota bacterium]MDA3019589.1 3-oxoacyl-ACP synthase III [Actinomycetota bacterium]